MTNKAIQIRDIQTLTTAFQAVAVEMTYACLVVTRPSTPMLGAGLAAWAGPECLADANPQRDSLGSHFFRAA